MQLLVPNCLSFDILCNCRSLTHEAIFLVHLFVILIRGRLEQERAEFVCIERAELASGTRRGCFNSPDLCGGPGVERLSGGSGVLKCLAQLLSLPLGALLLLNDLALELLAKEELRL